MYPESSAAGQHNKPLPSEEKRVVSSSHPGRVAMAEVVFQTHEATLRSRFTVDRSKRRRSASPRKQGAGQNRDGEYEESKAKSNAEGAPSLSDGNCKVVRFCEIDTSMTVVREVDNCKTDNHHNRPISPNRSRPLDTGAVSVEDDVSDSSPSADQLEWLLNWMNAPGTRKVRNRRCSVEYSSDGVDSEDDDEIWNDRECGYQENVNVPIQHSSGTVKPANHAKESADTAFPSPPTVPLKTEAGDGDSEDDDTSKVTIRELRQVVLRLQETVNDKDKAIAELGGEMEFAVEEHAKKENESNASISKLERKLKRTTAKDKNKRKEIGRLTRQLEKLESELEEADEICELSNLQMKKMVAAFDVERRAAKQEAARKALEYESVIAELETRISERHVDLAQGNLLAECCIAVPIENETPKDRETLKSRYLKHCFASCRQRCLLCFCALLFILSVFAKADSTIFGIDRFASVRTRVMPKWMNKRATTVEQQNINVSKWRSRLKSVLAVDVEDFYLF